MKIKGIEGLTVSGGQPETRVVRFNGQHCPLIKRQIAECQQDTSYRGCILDSWETYQTPIGVVSRHYWARGAGLEKSGVDWRIVPVTELEAAQERFKKASVELLAAREALEALVAGGKGAA